MGKSKRKDSKLEKMGARVNYTRNKSWNTRSNKIRQVRTPGGRLAAQYVTKKAKGPGNGMRTSSLRLGGLSRMRPTDYKRTAKHTRRICRAYGGVYSHIELKNRIIRTFLTEEVKNVKKTMALQASAEAKKNKDKKKGKGGQKKGGRVVKKKD